MTFTHTLGFYQKCKPITKHLQCPNVSGNMRMEDGRKNPFFISNFNNDRPDDFIWHTQLLDTDTDPSEIWLHRKGSLWTQLVWIKSVNSIPSPYESATLLVDIPLKIKDDARH